MMFFKSTIWSILFVILAGGALYHTSYEVQSRQAQLESLKKQAAAKRENIQTLRVELSHLSSPERIKRLADTHLMLFSTDPSQITTLASLPDQDLPAVLQDTQIMAAAMVAAPTPGYKPKSFVSFETTQRRKTILEGETFSQSSQAANVRPLENKELASATVRPQIKPISVALSRQEAPKYHRKDLEEIIASLEVSQ